MTEKNLNSIAETEAGYGELFAVLIRRRFWLLSVLCIVLAVATVKALKEKPTYKSSMQLLVESNYQGKKGSKTENQFADSNVEIDNATQLSLMQGSLLIQRAVKLLRPDYPDIEVEEIKKSLAVKQVADEKANTQTKIFEVTYTANNPTKTQKVLQIMQLVYLDYNREQQRLRLTKGLAFIDEQLPKVRGNVAQVEATLEEFRKNQNLIEPEVQAKALTEAINNIQQERRTNQATRRDLQAQYDSLQQQLASSPQEALVSARLSQSSRYQALLNEIQKTDLAIAQQRIRFTDKNPVIQKLLSERNKQLSLLQAEGERATPEVSAQLPGTGESFLKERQLGATDLTIATKLLEVQTSLKGLSARDEAQAKKEQQLRVELDLFPNLLAKYTRLQTDIQLKRETFQQLEKARQDLSLEIARGGFDWQVVEVPQPGIESSSKKRQNIMLGVVVGLFLGVAVAFARDMLDDSVHSSDQLTRLVPLPLLGMTPQLPQVKQKKPIIKLPLGKWQSSAAWASEPIIKLPFGKPEGMAPCTIEVIHSPPAWESFDLIYKNIQLQSSGSTFSPLIITSALDGEGKSTIALGLAISAARLHQRVLLIDADFRQPMLHKQLNLPNEYGLSTLLESNAKVPIPSHIPASDLYIDILTCGPIPKDPVNLLSSPQMQRLMAGFEQTYDLVLLNAPPVLGMVDALLVASCCRGVALVTRIDRVTKTALTETTAMLNKLNTIGVIANGGISLKKSNRTRVKL
ncbi:polysaccharide biosynthesis tyrosine autokinase [Microcoleus sp. AR_TQ3_B6]|uniref:polysaccharide biosynthesis tyrosine autokinase n=1 Tax=Microcoleus sp. AR_TQ3_B6 TaxID=3055284 RepID=UPI002FD55C94